MYKHINVSGRRKTSVARINLKIGNGYINIKNKCNKLLQSKKFLQVVQKPLKVSNSEKKFDFCINVQGGGLTGQAEAIQHGISKALVLFEEKYENTKNIRKQLKKLGFLTRDSRKVERKKIGKRKARKEEQYSKR